MSRILVVLDWVANAVVTAVIAASWLFVIAAGAMLGLVVAGWWGAGVWMLFVVASAYALWREQ